MVYFRMNRIDEALADLNAALDLRRGCGEPVSARRGAQAYGQDAKAGAGADLAAARLMSPKIDEEYARYGIKY
jgi:hypothetical protein